MLHVYRKVLYFINHFESNEINKNFRTSNNQYSIKILAPDVFNYEYLKSKSWRRAKKIRKLFRDYKSPSIFVIENRVCVNRRCSTIINN